MFSFIYVHLCLLTGASRDSGLRVNITSETLDITVTVEEEHAILTDQKIVLQWMSMRIFLKFRSEFSV